MSSAKPILILLFTGCQEGDWAVSTWGEEYIEDEIPASDFSDGCTASFERFSVNITEAALLDGDGNAAGEAPTGRFEMTTPGPQALGAVTVPATFYDTAQFTIAPTGDDAIHAVGTLTCGAQTVTFDWSFDTATTYRCAPEGLTVPTNGQAETELTIHGDHFFYEALEAEDAELRGQPIIDADADGDGDVTLDELSAVSTAGLGYRVGQYSEVTDLGAFVTFLTRTLGHVDGEGHCQVDL
ncbi:MAG: hypothetical protein AAFV53_35750 [Myxococcota bacterium]